MKYAIISDAHANPDGLARVLADARNARCTRFIFLGDITGYGYDVKRTFDLVRANFNVVLMGNHDSACVGLEPEALLKKYRNFDSDVEHRKYLSAEEMTWLRTRGYTYAEGDLAFSHANFHAPKRWGYIDYVEDAKASFAARPERLLFVGHTHEAAIWELTAQGECKPLWVPWFKKPAGKRNDWISFFPNKTSRYIVNTGSAGYPRDDLCSAYAIYDSETGRVVIRRLTFNFIDYVEKLLRAKVVPPRWLFEHAEARSGRIPQS